jgi:hypothetical protein
MVVCCSHAAHIVVKHNLARWGPCKTCSCVLSTDRDPKRRYAKIRAHCQLIASQDQDRLADWYLLLLMVLLLLLFRH